MTKKETDGTWVELASRVLDKHDSLQQPGFNIKRRLILKGGGMLFGASGALAALASPASANSSDEDANKILGLWQGVISAQDNSFPPFKTFELYGGGLWISSGQNDLTPASLSSTLWGAFQCIGMRTVRGIGRFWLYDPSANSIGFATLEQITTVSEDGKTYHGEGPLQFFDNRGNPLGPPTTILDNGTRIAFL